MSEEIRENLNPMEDDVAENIDTPETADEITEPAESVKSEKPAKPEKPAKTKAHRMTKEEKEAAREAAKNKSKAQKAWEDSIVANKRVKREEFNRKVKKAMLILLIFSLLITSTVYVMLLFIDANNVRITATSTKDKAIGLSYDKKTWTPYLDVDGPDNMYNISYNPKYGTETKPPSFAEIEKAMKEGAEQGLVGGKRSEKDLIAFCFYLQNMSDVMVPYTFEMVLESNDKGLEDSLRVIWATHVISTEPNREDRPQTTINCYASLSSDERLAYNNYVEKVAYPQGVESWTAEQFEAYEYGQELDYQGNPTSINLKDEQGKVKYNNVNEYLDEIGYVNTTPFYSDDCVVRGESYLDTSEMVCIYVCVWIEGSDYECKDKVLGGYVTLSIKFTAN